MDSSERIIVALDFGSADDALAVVDRLGGAATHYKVGLQLLTAAGPGIVRDLVSRGKRVFLDLKLLEIPTSVAGAVASAGELGGTMVTVHASGGRGPLRAAVAAARPYPHMSVIALTVITSMTARDLADIGVSPSVEEQVERLARLAVQEGCHGIVASPREAPMLRRRVSREASIVTPGLHVAGDGPNDHARTATPFEAIRSGATHVVIGRAITGSSDPVAAFSMVHDQVAEALVA